MTREEFETDARALARTLIQMSGKEISVRLYSAQSSLLSTAQKAHELLRSIIGRPGSDHGTQGAADNHIIAWTRTRHEFFMDKAFGTQPFHSIKLLTPTFTFY